MIERRTPPGREVPPWVRAGEHLAHGLTLAAAVAVFTAVGHAVDRWLGTAPWFLLVGAVLGFVGGLLHVVLRVSRSAGGAGSGRRGGASGSREGSDG